MQAKEAYHEAVKKGLINPEKIPEPDVSKVLCLALFKLDEDPAFTGMYRPAGTGNQKAVMEEEVAHSDLIGKLLEQNAAPAGVIERMTHLEGYNFSFIFDDSGSMTLISDAKDPKTATPLDIIRWEEAKNEAVDSIVPLAFVPAPYIEVSFLNNRKVTNFYSTGYKDPTMALKGLRHSFAESFRGVSPTYSTPMGKALIAAFRRNTPKEHLSQPELNKTSFHIYTDGAPNDGHTTKEVQKLIAERIFTYPNNTFSFHSCTNDDKQVEWCKTLESTLPRTSESDDFFDERFETFKSQGNGFLYTKGLHNAQRLLSALPQSAYDLNALDEPGPLPKVCIDAIQGIPFNEAEYKHYFDQNNLFMTDKLIGARDERTEELVALTPSDAKDKRKLFKYDQSGQCIRALNIGKDRYGAPTDYSQEDIDAGIQKLALEYAPIFKENYQQFATAETPEKIPSLMEYKKRPTQV